MPNKVSTDSNVERREFIKLAGVGAGAALGGMTGCAGTHKSSSGSNRHERRFSGAACGSLSENHVIHCDVAIVGGGMSGVCAALAAARNGIKVLLIQDRSVLGGNSSSEIRMHIVGADTGCSEKNFDSRESGIIEELRLEEAVRNPQRSASMWDLILYEWVMREPNIELLLDTYCCGAKMANGNKIESIFAVRPGTEDTFEVYAQTFIDCSGDGRLGAEAGAEYRMGREGRDEFNESLAPPKPDSKTLGSSILFITREHDRPMPFYGPDWIRKFPTKEDLPHRSPNPWEYGFWWVEWGGELNTIKDNERIRNELLAAALGVWDRIKNSGDYPESENWALEWIGALPGKRESRRFMGDAILTEGDLHRGETFRDGVAYGGWPIDLHPPKGIYSKERPNIADKVPFYNIPFRCLYSRNITNLMFAGRNISTSHVAFGSTRVMGTCSLMGQAVGTAAALCSRYKCTPRELGSEAIGELQQMLLKDDAYILGIVNNDPYDLARKATIRCSSETAEGPGHLVINGIHRKTVNASNCWISNEQKGLPQWLELRFTEPKRIQEIHLTFDSGLNRFLTLTHSDRHNAKMIRSAQPETIHNYDVCVFDGESTKTIARIEGNHQRKVIHRFDPLTAQGVGITIRNTNGAANVRLFEVRVY